MNKESKLRNVRNHMQWMACFVDVNTIDYKKLCKRIEFVEKLLRK